LEIYDDVVHAWQMLDGIVPEASAALDDAANFIRQLPVEAMESRR